MGFSATSPVIDTNVKNLHPFFPDLSTKEFADASRLDGSVTPERMKQALLFSMAEINRELKIVKFPLPILPEMTLADYDLAYLTNNVFLYKTAIWNEARAKLTEHYRDFDSTSDSTKRGDLLTPQIDAYRRDVRHAINLILGNDDPDDSGFMVVELI
ncbi:hypothetical protein AFK20_01565 [Enhydrobacter aerosaccus]|mgnify:FL=1|jgi:hypothetical protein|uniref:Phage head completion protein (GPL) n=1 Tax=Enhydrobacter aerosaccus TaxID=225324 RepID=A0ABR5IP77_9HYPH|nr:head completion/stabilization protein [Enhydrobacter aerosaccus]KND22815.1 hypothetical protein AFK20_01565 [Enhydrobacter aerosaccus]